MEYNKKTMYFTHIITLLAIWICTFVSVWNMHYKGELYRKPVVFVRSVGIIL